MDKRVVLTVRLTVGSEAGDIANQEQLDAVVDAINTVAYVETIEIQP